MSEKKEEVINFEEELNTLNEIVEKIENNVLPLDESIKLFEKGSAIIKKLNGALKEAETKMAKIISTESK